MSYLAFTPITYSIFSPMKAHLVLLHYHVDWVVGRTRVNVISTVELILCQSLMVPVLAGSIFSRKPLGSCLFSRHGVGVG
jgi:hypothetical protein